MRRGADGRREATHRATLVFIIPFTPHLLAVTPAVTTPPGVLPPAPTPPWHTGTPSPRALSLRRESIRSYTWGSAAHTSGICPSTVRDGPPLEMRWVGARLARWTRVPSACPQVPLSSPASLAPPDQVRSSSAWLLASPRAPRQHSFAPAGDRSRRDAAVGITTLVRHHVIPRLALEQPALGRDAVR